MRVGQFLTRWQLGFFHSDLSCRTPKFRTVLSLWTFLMPSCDPRSDEVSQAPGWHWVISVHSPAKTELEIAVSPPLPRGLDAYSSSYFLVGLNVGLLAAT
jgi:hypothetical protein